MASKNFEGVHWQATVIYSNRFPNRVELTNVGSDGYFKVPESRADSVIEQLESGVSPDAIAQSLPVEF